jgi:hypothetical protein
MAAYDPKRPRPVVDRDEPAPVDALIDATPTAEVPVVEPDPDPVVLEDESVEDVAVDEPADDVPAHDVAGDEPVDDEPDERPTTPVGSVVADPPRPGSDVPVAEPPEGTTANRAVMFVMFGAAAATLVALLVFWRRRR